VVADELELSLLNSGLGMHSPTGRWATYNTPMDGVRRASAHDIAFQAREGTPELNCCSVNSARGLGLLSEWALMRGDSGLTLNWLGPATFDTQLAGGENVSLNVATDYPRSGHVQIAVSPVLPTKFTLNVRNPYWSAKTEVKLNGERLTDVKCGQYLVIDRTWKAGDKIELDLDFSLHFWVGERECAGKVSAYRGPILLTYDRRFNTFGPDGLPRLDAREMTGKISTWEGRRPPYLLLDFQANDGQTVRLCDFASAGNGGSPYLSWLKIDGATASQFSPQNPLRSSHISTMAE
jgi:DUF1680 family protein